MPPLPISVILSVIGFCNRTQLVSLPLALAFPVNLCATINLKICRDENLLTCRHLTCREKPTFLAGLPGYPCPVAPPPAPSHGGDHLPFSELITQPFCLKCQCLPLQQCPRINSYTSQLKCRTLFEVSSSSFLPLCCLGFTTTVCLVGSKYAVPQPWQRDSFRFSKSPDVFDKALILTHAVAEPPAVL